MDLKKKLFIFFLLMISFVLGAASYKHKKYLTSFKINLFDEDSSYKIKKAINKVDFISNNNFQLLNYFIPESESIVNTMYLSLLIQKYDLNLITGEDNKSKGAICIFENKLIIINGSMKLVLIDLDKREFMSKTNLDFDNLDPENIKVNDLVCKNSNSNNNNPEFVVSIDYKIDENIHQTLLYSYKYNLDKSLLNKKLLFKTNLITENNAGRVASNDFIKFYLSFSSDQHDLNKTKFNTYPSQDLKNNILSGKILEIDSKKNTYKFFSHGHRNPQGLFLDGKKIFSTEHGPKGGDELNLIIDGKNYGWPISSTGSDYNSYKPLYGELGRHSEFTKPIYSWDPGIGISNLIKLYNFNDSWNRDLIITSLKTRSIYRVRLNKSGYVSSVENIFIGNRIRDIAQYKNEILLWTDDKKIIFIKNTLFPVDKKWVDVRDPAIAYCFTCHHLGETNQANSAPTLLNIFTKPAGSDPSYQYSNVLKNSKFKWNEKNLKKYLLDPQNFLPGTLKKVKIRSEEEANKIIEILKKVSIPQ